MTEEEIPEDLGLKIGTHEEVFWTDIKKKMEEGIKNAEHEIEINKHVLKLAEARIAEESEKLK